MMWAESAYTFRSFTHSIRGAAEWFHFAQAKALITVESPAKGLMSSKALSIWGIGGYCRLGTILH